MEPKVIKYEIVWDRNPTEFESQINKKLSEGWELHGETWIENDASFWQPMILRNKEAVKSEKPRVIV